MDAYVFKRLDPSHKASVLVAMDGCEPRTNEHSWNGDENSYPGCMIAGDLASGNAYGLCAGEVVKCYALLSPGTDIEYGRVPDFDASLPAFAIHRLITAGDVQRRGLAAELVNRLCGVAESRGAQAVYVDILGPAEGLLRFYSRLGFVTVGDFIRDDVGGKAVVFRLMVRTIES